MIIAVTNLKPFSAQYTVKNAIYPTKISGYPRNPTANGSNRKNQVITPGMASNTLVYHRGTPIGYPFSRSMGLRC